MNVFDFLILALATWRLSSLFVSERGPGIFKRKGKDESIGLFESIRELNGIYPNGVVPKNEIGKLLACIMCFSMWTGAGLALSYFLLGQVVVYLCLPLALSAAAIIVEKVVG